MRFFSMITVCVPSPISSPLVTDELRPAWERWLHRLFGAQAKMLGFSARAQDSDDTLRLRPALLDFLATDGNDAALSSFAEPVIARSALALLLDPAHDYREVSQIAWTMSATPRGGERTYAFMKANFDALVARAPRYTGGPRILAQSLERITLCAAFKERQHSRFTIFLGRQ